MGVFKNIRRMKVLATISLLIFVFGNAVSWPPVCKSLEFIGADSCAGTYHLTSKIANYQNVWSKSDGSRHIGFKWNSWSCSRNDKFLNNGQKGIQWTVNNSKHPWSGTWQCENCEVQCVEFQDKPKIWDFYDENVAKLFCPMKNTMSSNSPLLTTKYSVFSWEECGKQCR